MKKIVCFALTLVLMLTYIAYAEDFSLRNGIAFGDSMEDVQSKETFETDKIEDGSDKESEDPDENEEDNKYPYSITTKKGTLAGINDSYIIYKFDAEKKLRNVDYFFRSSSLKESADSDYNDVNAGLVRKYGQPLGYSNGDMYIVSGSAIEGAVLSVYLFKYLDGVGDIRDYDEWDVDAGDYHVKIEQAEYYCGSSYSEITYSHRMSYTYFTDEDLQAEQDSKSERQSNIDNDL